MSIETGEELDNLEASLQEQQDSIHTEEQDPTGDQTAQVVDYDDMDEDDLRAMLKQKTEALEKKDQSSKELQSLHDKHYNQQKEEMIKLQTQIEMLQKQQVAPKEQDSTLSSEDQAKFDEEWRSKLQEDPSAAIDFFRGIIGEIKADYEAKLDDVKASSKQEFLTRDSVYTANKEAIDQMVGKYNMDFASAISIYSDMTKDQVKQPGKVPAPGTTSVSNQPASRVAPAPQPIALDPMSANVMKLAGLDEKSIKKITKKVAHDLAQ